MKKRFINRKSSGERIKELMKYKGIKKAPDLARALMRDGIIPDKRQDKEAVRYTADTIHKHLTDKQLPDRKWIYIYCDFFKCSSDYLMGYIDHPTQAITDICDKTGLSEKAAAKLIDKASRTRIYAQVLSWLIESDTFDPIISRINSYIQIKWIQAASKAQGHPDKKIDKDLTKEEERLFFISHTFVNLIQDIATKQAK